MIKKGYIRVKIINEYDEDFLDGYLKESSFSTIESILKEINREINFRDNKQYLTVEEILPLIKKSSILSKFFENYGTFSKYDYFNITKIDEDEYFEN